MSEKIKKLAKRFNYVLHKTASITKKADAIEQIERNVASELSRGLSNTTFLPEDMTPIASCRISQQGNFYMFVVRLAFQTGNPSDSRSPAELDNFMDKPAIKNWIVRTSEDLVLKHVRASGIFKGRNGVIKVQISVGQNPDGSSAEYVTYSTKKVQLP